MRIALASALLFVTFQSTASNMNEAVTSQVQLIVRKSLQTAVVDDGKLVTRVETKMIEFTAGQTTARHVHPVPVVGYVVEGSVRFQISGQAPQTLNAGDAFYEPANVVIDHFDALDQPVQFVANYLMGPGDHELIKMLK